MRLRIRTLILTVALLASWAPAVDACCFIPVIDPFHWLFGCGCYQGYGYGGGYSGGYAAPPMYSGYGGYQPAYQNMMGGQCAPCGPLGILPAPFRLPRCLPVPAIFRSCWDPCNTCAAPCMPNPMVQYQPAMMPAPVMQPPVMQYPMMQPMMQPLNSGCGSDCGASSYGGYSGQTEAMMPEMTIPMQMQTPMMNGPSMPPQTGCCGTDNLQSSYQPGRSASLYSGYPQSNVQAWMPSTAWSPTAAWSPQGTASGNGFPTWARHSSLPPTAYGVAQSPRFARRDNRRAAMQYRKMNSQQQHPSMAAQNSGMMAMPYGYSSPAQSAWAQPSYQQSESMPVQMMPTQSAWAPQTMVSPMSAPPMSSAMMSPNPGFSGDVTGDHEDNMTETASAPVTPISYNGVTPFLRTNLTAPLTTTSAQYTRSVR